MNALRKSVFPVLLALAALLPQPCLCARDSDGDGMSDALEETLGSDPNFKDTFQLIYQDGTPETGDKNFVKQNYEAKHDLVNVYLASVGGDRFVWKIEFAAPFDHAKSCLHIYLDSDANPDTGREGYGVEYMLTAIGGGFHASKFLPDGTRVDDSPPAGAVEGNFLYMSKSVPLKQENGRSKFRVFFLSQRITGGPDLATIDTTDRLVLTGPPISSRKKMLLPEELEESFNVEATFGLDLVRKVLADRDNVVIPIQNCEYDGFRFDTNSTYKRASACLTRKGGTLTAVISTPGRYYPGFLMYDDSTDERIGIRINGKLLGVAVSDTGNRRTWICWLSEPYDFKGGETLTLVGLGGRGRHRIENPILLKRKPPIRKREFKFTNIQATLDFRSAPSPRAEITYISTWPVTTTVEYGPTASYGKRVTCDLTVNNHRIWIEQLEKNRQYHFRVSGKTPAEKAVVSRDFTFSTAPPPPATGSVKRQATPLTVRNDSDTRYTAWPVTCGLPFAKGELGSAAGVRLLDPDGQEVPLQVEERAWWPDGSVKWLLLNFQADCPPRTSVRYTVEFGTDVKRSASPPKPVTAKESPDAVTVNTGRLRFTVNKKSLGLIRNVIVDLNSDGRLDEQEQLTDPKRPAAIALTGVDGKTYTTLHAPDRITVEEPGPLRAVVKVEGQHKDADGKPMFAYVLRIHAYAGKPFVRIFYTFGNDVPESEFSEIKSIALRLPLCVGEDASVTIAGDKPAAFKPAGKLLRLFQRTDDGYEITLGGRKESQGRRAAGWIDLTGRRAGVSAAIRHFWQLYPKAVSSDGTGITLEICPAFEKGFYDSFPFEKEGHKLFFYLANGRYKFRQGLSKRHEIFLAFHPGAPGAALDTARRFENPLIPAAPPERYCAAKVFYEMAPEDRDKFKLYEEGIADNLERYVKQRDKQRDYGMLNFGDWYGERYVNWGNIEYDTQHCFFLQFMRSGDPRYFLQGEITEWHNMDVDTVHYHRDPKRVGGVWAHCIGHTGGYFDKAPHPLGFYWGGMTVTHTWVEGHLEYYFLTGDRRALETAKSIADRYDTYYTVNYDYTNCRVPGWHLILSLAMYNATGDPFHLNAARIVMERVLERQGADGGWCRQLGYGHCNCLPHHYGNTGFMMAILLSGMKYYHFLTGDERLVKAIPAGARYLLRETWSDETCGFRYTSCPIHAYGHGASPLMLEGVAYAYRLSKDPVLKEVVRKGLSLRGSPYGKSFSMFYRSGPRLLYDIALMGLTLDKPYKPPRKPFVKPAWLQKAPADGIAIVQAEDFSDQGAGQVRIMEDRPTTWGTMITYWDEDIGHWLEWKLRVPSDGKYRCILRYATGEEHSRRSFKLDGESPHPSLADIHFPCTGGFGVRADQWRYFTLRSSDGKPLLFDLKAGQHTIRMKNLGDGLGVDFILLLKTGLPGP